MKNYFICKVPQLEFKIVLEMRIPIHFCHSGNSSQLQGSYCSFSSMWLEICAKGPHSYDVGNVTVLNKNSGCGLGNMVQLVEYLLCKSEDLSMYIQHLCEQPDVTVFAYNPSPIVVKIDGSLELSDHQLINLPESTCSWISQILCLKNKMKGNWRR